ncbi:hypothetical protein S40288_11783, partial [Stachybotrys chartarum IBT 40288]
MTQRLRPSPVPRKVAHLGSEQHSPILAGNENDCSQENQHELVSLDDDELPTIEQIIKEVAQQKMRNKSQRDNETPIVHQPLKRGREEERQSVFEEATSATKRHKDDNSQWQNHDTLPRLRTHIKPSARYSQVLEDETMNSPLPSCVNRKRRVTNKSKKPFKPYRN